MIPHPFDLETPRSRDEAVECLARHGDDCRALAGGTVLIPEMTYSRITPRVVVDLSHTNMDTVRSHAGELLIGATATYRQLASTPAASSLTVSSWLGTVVRGITGGAQIRNCATIGGSAAYANPASDVPAVLVALDAVMNVVSVSGNRELPASDFFTGAFRTSRRPDELLASIRLPEQPPGTRFGYEKLKFGESSWPIVTTTAIIRPNGLTRLTLGGCCPTPVTIEIEDPRQRGLDEAVVAAITDPWSDVLADAAYRRAVAPIIARRALQSAT